MNKLEAGRRASSLKKRASAQFDKIQNVQGKDVLYDSRYLAVLSFLEFLLGETILGPFV